MKNYQFIKVVKIKRPNFTIHCVQSPIEGEMTNAQLIESENHLLLIDTLQLKPHADELLSYISELGKPLERVLITHDHPDHWFGAASFKDFPLYAFPEVIEKINYLADFLLDFHRSVHGEKAAELITSEKVTPSLPITEGYLNFDGIELKIIKVLETESSCNLMVEIVNENILIAQDIIYNGAFAFFGEKTRDGSYCFDNWIKTLNQISESKYDVIIPGHGNPTDNSIIPIMVGYLNFAHSKLDEGLSGEELIKSIKDEYPNYLLPLTLQMSNYMLFQQ